ncbi:MAG: Aspartate--tRNA ligase [Methanoregulaceae archaeon PtaB.Bin056]|nr:MAG: Aspartate--tRNA ligase [Methanoregulaceae archaeon PtaB.Bin056]
MEYRQNDLAFDPQRLEKVRELQAAGVPLYPAEFEGREPIASIRGRYADIGHEKSGERVCTAGRLYTVRNHGKTIFADLQDESGRIQLYIRKNDLGAERFDFFQRSTERGDIVGVRGHVFRTKVGEISLWVDEIVLLTKSLCPLPEKFHGLKDIEKRYRQRYVDLIVNEDVRETFRTRSRIVSLIRNYLTDRGFLEFETPILQPIYGGANARPFTTFHHYLQQTLFMRIAPELYLKRLVVGGFEKVFELARNFRNEDIDTHHNPEFSMVEVYEAYRDYRDMMGLAEEMISSIVREIHGTYQIPYGDVSLDFSPPWKKMSMDEAVKELAGIDIWSHSLDDLRRIAAGKRIEGSEDATNHRELLVLLFEALVEDQLVQPTFVYDFPIENSPLAKKHRSREGFTERFELFICGMEVANGFSELNDPLDQLARFERQDEKRRAGDLEAQMLDYDFINALGYGMPPTGGVGVGIDRLVMLLTNKNSIKEVILFPQMKPEAGSEKKDISEP